MENFTVRDDLTRNLQTAERCLTAAAKIIHAEEGRGFDANDYTRICKLRNQVGEESKNVQQR